MRRTIPELFRTTVEAVPDTDWLHASGAVLTYGEALNRVERAASWLRQAGIGMGDRVLVTARNEADDLLGWLALMEVGAIQVPVNPKSAPAELAGFLAQVRPALVVTDSELAPMVAGAIAETSVAARLAMGADAFEGPSDGRGPVALEPETVAVMIPTSGTTGRSKLVMQTHLAYVMAGEGFPYWMQLGADDRLMTSLPLFHINAVAYSTLGSVAAGAGLVLLPRFSPSTFLDDARRFGATEFNSIGAMLELLARQPERPDDADNPIRCCYTGPSPTEARQLEIEERFGFELVCGYGLSESPYGLIWRPGTRPYGTLGAPRQHPELGHVNDARVVVDGRDVAAGDVGELLLRNPVVTPGYFEMPEETAAVLRDGWLHTGDLVRDEGDGNYTFVGRVKEVIRRRGENLSPAEVEATLEAHPDVAEAAVVGVASELSEQDVKAFVVAAPGRSIDISALHAFAGERLARFKVPRYVEVVADLPHTATGRIAKHQLPQERTPQEIDMEARPNEPEPAGEWLRTSIGSTAPDRITVAGRDLASEVMGELTLTELAYLLLRGRTPTPGERRLLDAVLVSLADHGFTPSSLAARLTYTGAPEAVQAAVAAGLLGAGSVFLGPAGDTAEFLAGALARAGVDASGLDASDPDAAVVEPADLDGAGLDDAALRRIAHAAVEDRRRQGLRVPGLGHPVHRDEDPRTPRIYEIATEEGVLGPHLRLLRQVAAVHEELTGKHLPVNGAGAAGAALADLGLPPGIVRGFVLIGRTAGLVAHLAEEAETPVGLPLWLEVERRASGAPEG